MDVGMVRQRRLADDIVAQLETMILEGTLKAGERLPAERVLAERFGVSRPSLREAIQKLAAKGLLISRHGGGTFVAESLGSTFSDPLLQPAGKQQRCPARPAGVPAYPGGQLRVLCGAACNRGGSEATHGGLLGTAGLLRP